MNKRRRKISRRATTRNRINQSIREWMTRLLNSAANTSHHEQDNDVSLVVTIDKDDPSRVNIEIPFYPILTGPSFAQLIGRTNRRPK